jgi:hypothetical protein
MRVRGTTLGVELGIDQNTVIDNNDFE